MTSKPQSNDLWVPDDGRWTYPMTLKELAAAVGMSPRSFKRYLLARPGSHVLHHHTCYQVCLDRIHPALQGLLGPYTLPPTGTS